MRNSLPRALALAGSAALALVVAGLGACPLSHDAYETNRPCWNGNTDCVTSELCAKADGAALDPGRCDTPSDGPCGFLDGGADAGYHCFPDENGMARTCLYDPQFRCLSYVDAGTCPEAGCPDDWCTRWKDLWGCQ